MSDQQQAAAALEDEKAGNAQHDETQNSSDHQQPETQAPLSDEDMWEQEAESERSGLMEGEPKGDEADQEADQGDGDERGDPDKGDEGQLDRGQESTENEDNFDLKAWFESQPEKAKKQLSDQYAQLQTMQKHYNSLHGRLAPVQREVSQLKAQNQELEKRLKAFDSAPASLEELDNIESFKFLAEDSPKDADALKKAVGQMVNQQVQEVEAKLDQTSRALESLRNESQSRELQRLTHSHPDWQSKVNSQDFNYWVQAQAPQDQQQISQMLSSPYADENIAVLSAFDEALKQVRGQAADNQARQPQPPPQQSTEKRPTSRRPPPSATPPPQGSGLSGPARIQGQKSEEEMWAELARKDKDKPIW